VFTPTPPYIVHLLKVRCHSVSMVNYSNETCGLFLHCLIRELKWFLLLARTFCHRENLFSLRLLDTAHILLTIHSFSLVSMQMKPMNCSCIAIIESWSQYLHLCKGALMANLQMVLVMILSWMWHMCKFRPLCWKLNHHAWLLFQITLYPSNYSGVLVMLMQNATHLTSSWSLKHIRIMMVLDFLPQNISV